MTKGEWLEAWRKARCNGGQSIGGLYISPAIRLAARAEVEPRRTYWAVLSQNIDSIARGWGQASRGDRAFYVRRARAIRLRGYRDNWPEVKAV